MSPTSAPLFSTRITPPPVRAPLVARPRLLQRMNQGLQRRLTLVSAPAGYGKTTLLAEWAAGVPLPVAWLALDDGDNDPGRFTASLWASIQRVFNGPDWPALADLAELPPEAALQHMLLSLAQAGQPLALVWDDYHALRSPALHQAVAAFVDHLPAHLHLVIATRRDPPIPLARLRAQDELVEVRAEQLRFSPEESADFLERRMGLRLSPSDLETLTRRTEGWAAGLQLAALSLLEQPDPRPFIQSLSGSHRFILEYLIEEVLETQPPEIQTFLLRTSLLRRLNAALCDALLDDPHPPAAGTLAYLERANLFLTPLDPERQWFRYHHLFADLLRRRLKETAGPEEIARLHRRAAGWYHAAGDGLETIHHALAGGDWPAAAEMLAHWGNEFFKTGALGTYLSALKSLPEEVLHSHPQLLQDLGWGLALTNDLDQAEHYLELAAEARRDDPNFTGETLAGMAFAAIYRFDLQRALPLARQALELIAPENEWMRSVAAMVLGLVHWNTGDPKACQQAMQTARRAAVRTNAPRVYKMATAYLGRARALEMDLLAAEELALEAIGSGPQPQLVPGNETPAFDLAALYTEWNELDKAEHYLQLGLSASRVSGNLLIRSYSLRIQARLLSARGDARGAWAAAQQAVQAAAELGLGTSFQHLNAACCAEVALAMGDLELATAWAERITGPEGLDPFDPLPLLVRARVSLAAGRHADARQLLAGLEPLTTAPAWRQARFRLRLLQALACPQRAAELLTPELPAALRQKLYRTFVDLGAPAAGVLRRLPTPEDPALAARLVDLIQACEAAPSGGTAAAVPAQDTPAPPPGLEPLVEPLSQRELEVLRLLAQGLGTSEIAAALYIAESTVRSHVKKIFSRLGVHSRLQAVDQARRRGLI